MNRARGKRTPRKPEISPEKADEYGIETDRNIPGGETHLINRQVLQQQVPTPEPLAPFRGQMAHGVPPHEFEDRKPPSKPRTEPKYAELPKQRPAIPVVVVDDGSGSRPLRITTTKHFQVPAIGEEPGLVCGKDVRRHAVYVLNEGIDSALGMRIGNLQDLAFDADNGELVGGGLLPNAMTSYQKFEGQSPLYVVSMDDNTPVISVIIETSTPGAG